jgi:iron(II)-dependent oxidoreductase
MTAQLATAELQNMLRDCRVRTLELVVDLTPDQLFGPRLDIVNPLLWEIGHLAWFHEYFALPLPQLNATLEYMRSVQEALLARLKGPIASEEESLLYQLVAFHEDMHAEAFTYTRQTLGYPEPKFTGSGVPADAEAGPWPGDVEIPGGTFLLGAPPSAPFVFDNEKWAHPVTVSQFRIARGAVTNAEFAAFVDDGGYQQRNCWDDEGWRWREAAKAEHPVYWQRAANAWTVRRFDQYQPPPPHQPVVHVNWYEANAWCRWAGRRLPTELEWEVAASTEPSEGGLSEHKRRYPWGDGPPTAARANLDGSARGCVDVAACPPGDSAWGCRQMLGNVWEWTASLFEPYPGFTPDVYEEYSAPWFGSRKVLRGGAWATRGRLITNTYRNFFTPDRRDVFAGFRTCAV